MRYDSKWKAAREQVPAQGMEGQLSEHPLAELIREGINAKLSGALRLTRERVKVAVYLAEGAVIFAASNLRAHRLSETLKHDPSLKNLNVDRLPTTHSDDQLSAALVERGLLTSELLRGIRERQVTEVLRVALLWTNGTWAFDPKIRIAEDLRTAVDVDRLLLECGRHLPASFVATRVNRTNGSFSRSSRATSEAPLLPAEIFVLSRVETYGAIYALSLAGLLDRSNWPKALLIERAKASQPKASAKRPAKSDDGTGEANEAGELNAFFARIDNAQDHYDVLDVGRLADVEEIKRAYHLLARRFHPDRFHQRETELRQRIEAAFARIAQAYETLSNGSVRAAYDGKLKPKSPATAAPKPAPTVSKSANAESSFQRGLAAMEQNQRDLGLRLLAEATMLEPRAARYRAQYGYALIKEPGTRRIAETELQAAISLEPKNASYRVMLAELYKQLGLRRRAEGELERALVADPKNEAARTLLSNLKKN